MKDKAKAKAGSIAAEIRRSTLRLDRAVARNGDRATDILFAAERVGHAKDRALAAYGGPRAAAYPYVVGRALRDANAAITRAYPLFEDML